MCDEELHRRKYVCVHDVPWALDTAVGAALGSRHIYIYIYIYIYISCKELHRGHYVCVHTRRWTAHGRRYIYTSCNK